MSEQDPIAHAPAEEPPVTDAPAEEPRRRSPVEALLEDGAQYRFTAGNQAAAIHGLYSKSPVFLPEEVKYLEAFEAGVVADLGGDEELTAIKKGYVQKLRTVEGVVLLAVRNIVKRGFDAKSEGMLLQAVDRWDRLALRLGLERRQKHVDPIDAVRQAVEEANRR